MYKVVSLKLLGWMLLILLIAGMAAACGSGGEQAAAEPVGAPAATAAEPTVAPTTAESAPTAASMPAAENSNQQAAATTDGAKTFQIVQDGTEARFSIDEVLFGQDKTVVGVTSLVQGQISVDPANPSSAQISAIQIDARDLTTDSDRRNGAIQRFILQSNRDEYQYITFEPTAIEGLPASVAVGQPFSFNVIGNLKIRDVVRPETFPITVTAQSENELAGSGAIVIKREDYQLTIPSVPSVAGVSEEVKLEIEFKAVTE